MEEKHYILIVDDDAQFIESIHAALSPEFIVQTAATESEALSGARQLQPELFIISLSAPAFDGFRVCQQVKNIQASASTPIIFVSDRIQMEEKMKCFMAGGIDYLIKPVERSECHLRIRTHLELKSAHESVQLYNQKLRTLLEERTRELIRSERQSTICLMIQGIIHNLRNPLVGILGYAEFIRTNADRLRESLEHNKRSTPDEYLHFMDGLISDVDAILAAGNLMNRMVDSLMVKSRSDKRMESETIDLNVLLRDELKFLSVDLKLKHHINTKIHLSANPLRVTVVTSEISQIFQNLMRNAIQALWQKKAATIVVESGGEENRVWFSVADNGVGISHHVIDRIFDPFFTTKPAPGGKDSLTPQGAGLGLYSCLELVKSYRGEINVSSEEGKGATFTVYLPSASEVSPHSIVLATTPNNASDQAHF